LPKAGDGQKVEFFLERVGSPWPYRTLRIWFNVNPVFEPTPSESAGRFSADGGGFPAREEFAQSLPTVFLWNLAAADRVPS
jgi:hypothetical protein